MEYDPDNTIRDAADAAAAVAACEAAEALALAAIRIQEEDAAAARREAAVARGDFSASRWGDVRDWRWGTWE